MSLLGPPGRVDGDRASISPLYISEHEDMTDDTPPTELDAVTFDAPEDDVPHIEYDWENDGMQGEVCSVQETSADVRLKLGEKKRGHAEKN